MTKELESEIITAECPICKCELTSWDDKQNSRWVCDTCGFGKGSMNEYKTLQKIVKYRNKWFEHDWMDTFKVSYLSKESLQ